MSNRGNNWGAGVLAMGELSRIENNARDAAAKASSDATLAQFRAFNAQRETQQITFIAKSQIHGLRALVEAHARTENELIAALRAENPNHPLSDRSVVDSILEQNRRVTIFDPIVTKRTYPEGVAPENSIFTTPDGDVSFCSGEPGCPGPSRAERLAAEARSTMMTALSLSESDMDNEAKLQSVIESQTAFAAEMNKKLADDKGKFFGMSGKKRAEMDERVAGVKMNIDQLKLAASQIPVRAEAARAEAEKAEQVEAAKVKLAAWRKMQNAPAPKG